MKTGTPKFTGVALANMSADFMKPVVELEGQVAFVDPTSGGTYAWTKFKQWSPQTLQKLRELRDSMEQDSANYFLSDSQSVEEVAVVQPKPQGKGLGSPPRGLGDYLEESADTIEASSI